jgi:hypothetical protein
MVTLKEDLDDEVCPSFVGDLIQVRLPCFVSYRMETVQQAWASLRGSARG